jgi:hypothetical protein
MRGRFWPKALNRLGGMNRLGCINANETNFFFRSVDGNVDGVAVYHLPHGGENATTRI